MKTSDKAEREYEYRFTFQDRTCKVFPIKLNRQSRVIAQAGGSSPPWAALHYQQCPQCSLDSKKHAYCPIAVNIASLVSEFIDCPSYKLCVVSCQSPERFVSKDTTVQKGLSSILGLLMATSGCPAMDFLRPLARFHLPFASVDESIFRSVAAYLLRQYFLNDEKKKTDFELNNIVSHYDIVKIVNRGMLNRIKNFSVRDADQNAIVTLNSLSQILEMEIDTNLESLRHYFQADHTV